MWPNIHHLHDKASLLIKTMIISPTFLFFIVFTTSFWTVCVLCFLEFKENKMLYCSLCMVHLSHVLRMFAALLYTLIVRLYILSLRHISKHHINNHYC